MSAQQTHSPAPGTALVVLQASEVAALVRDAIAQALEVAGAAASASPRPALLTKEQLARELGVSPRTVDRLRADGCPVVWVVESPRFQLDRVLAWLAARSSGAAPEPTANLLGNAAHAENRVQKIEAAE